MSERTRFVKADGTLLDGQEAELELARHDADKMLKDLKLDETKKESKANGEGSFEGTGRRLKSSKEPPPPAKGNDSSSHPQTDHDPSGAFGLRLPSFGRDGKSSFTTNTSGLHGGVATEPRSYSSSCKTSSCREENQQESKARTEAEEKEMKDKIKGCSSQMEKNSNEIWKFSKDAEETVYYFSLDIDTLWKKALGIVDTIQSMINETGGKVSSFLDEASGQTDSAISVLEKWGDMSKNIRDGSELLNNKVKEKTADVTGFAKILNDNAQKLAKSANTNLSNPLLQNVADMSVVSETISEMAGTGQFLTDSFTSIVEAQSLKLQSLITDASERVIALGESCGFFAFVKDLASEISKHLSELSKIIKQIRERVGGLLNKINGLFDMMFTALAKLSSIIEGVLGLDIKLMKEALKNGTIRPVDVCFGRVEAHFETEVRTRSSTNISGVSCTAGNVSAAGIVKDNSKSGHIEAAALDVKAANVDVAFKREGKVKRNLAYVKGANINAGNVRATAIDDREVETAVVGVSAAEVNVGNVVVEGLGKKGTYKHTTAQPSLTVGNVAVGVRRSTGTNIRAGPKLSAFNVDLTVGKPSLTNFLNQLGPGQSFGNIAIPFLGGGGGAEGGGKSSGSNGNGGGDGTICEPEGDAGFSSGRDFAVYGRPRDALIDDGKTTTDGGICGSQEKDRGGQGHAQNDKTTEGSCIPGSSGSCKMHGNIRANLIDKFPPKQPESGFDRVGMMEKLSSLTGCKGQIGKGSLQTFKNKGQNSSNRTNQIGQGALLGGDADPPVQHDFKQRRPGALTGQTSGNTYGQIQSTQRNETGQRGLLEESDPSNRNALGPGVYKKGDEAREQPEDYQSRLAALVKGELQSKVGKSKKIDSKKSDRKKKKPEKLDKESFRRQLHQECQEQLDEARGSGCTGESGGTAEGQEKKAKKPKPKAKPWGEHGNIHGFSTLGTESDKEIKKLGEGVYGFTDG